MSPEWEMNPYWRKLREPVVNISIWLNRGSRPVGNNWDIILNSCYLLVTQVREGPQGITE